MAPGSGDSLGNQKYEKLEFATSTFEYLPVKTLFADRGQGSVCFHNRPEAL
jgi:hypothetical protein